MKWTRLFPVRLRYARMVAASWTTIHPKEAGRFCRKFPFGNQLEYDLPLRVSIKE
jgi:hypothetical protein